MSKRCARCEKTVYPAEELKCLDKSWHKGCFKCQVCNMTLNMKNYKGYDKLPYCNAHYPQTKHTTVADTPEQRRIAENTKIQSTVKYHEEFEKMKGKKTSVADDPEFRRVKHNTEIQSNIAYHDIKGQREEQEARRPAEQVEAGRVRTNPGRIADYTPDEPAGGTPYSSRNSQGTKQVYDSNIGAESDDMRRVSRGSVKNRVDRFSSSEDDSRTMEQPSSRKVGSISDYDPLNDQYGSIAGQQPRRDQYASQPKQPTPQQSYQPPQPKYNPPPQQPRDPYAGKGMVVRAIYDYQAGDSDEVTFNDGDIIIMCQKIDDGWMEGTVERTGQHGMLPSNYVEPLN